MARDNIRVTVDELDTAVQQTLTIWHQEVNDAIDAASKQAADDLVKITKQTAPVGYRGSFKKHIASKEVTKSRGSNRGKTYAWYVKPPDHRLTHLLVHGHAKKNGGRTRANPFLANAMQQVLPEYENKIKEAISRGRD